MMSVAEIAKSLDVARQNFQRIAYVLEAEGLVEYADNQNHQRAKLVLPPKEARAALSAIAAGQARWLITGGKDRREDARGRATSVVL